MSQATKPEASAAPVIDAAQLVNFSHKREIPAGAGN